VAGDLAVAGTTDLRWAAQDTHPEDIEAALRKLLVEAHADNAAYVPARVLNLVCIVDHEYSGEIANRLRRVGRYHPSRTVVCSISRGRSTLDAVATIAAPAETKPGEFALTRETVLVEAGTKHLKHLDTIIDPLVVTDLPTVVWAPHGHSEAVDSVLKLCQVVLLDSVDEPAPEDAVRRARQLSQSVYVVDLAWLRSTPWRERLAATFDPPALRPDLQTISAVSVRHHPASQIAALLLVGWLGSRLGWKFSPLVGQGIRLSGTAHGRRQDVALCLEMAPELQVRGLASVTLETASGRHLRFDRGPGGLRATYRNRRGDERTWTVLGASRGEAGILGEGIRQALLRDPTYQPALESVAALLA
jgi:glucose-6-phosphate dehydrogenase assembly protein OpcA